MGGHKTQDRTGLFVASLSPHSAMSKQKTRSGSESLGGGTRFPEVSFRLLHHQPVTDAARSIRNHMVGNTEHGCTARLTALTGRPSQHTTCTTTAALVRVLRHMLLLCRRTRTTAFDRHRLRGAWSSSSRRLRLSRRRNGKRKTRQRNLARTRRHRLLLLLLEATAVDVQRWW